MNDVVRITLKGRPITKKNSQRIVRCGNFHRIMPSKQYAAYEEQCIKQLSHYPKLKIDRAVNVKCCYFMPTRHRVDLVNLLEATCDILVKTNLIEDDNSKIVIGHDGSRVFYDKDNPRVEIEITEGS